MTKRELLAAIQARDPATSASMRWAKPDLGQELARLQQVRTPGIVYAAFYGYRNAQLGEWSTTTVPSRAPGGVRRRYDVPHLPAIVAALEACAANEHKAAAVLFACGPGIALD